MSLYSKNVWQTHRFLTRNMSGAPRPEVGKQERNLASIRKDKAAVAECMKTFRETRSLPMSQSQLGDLIGISRQAVCDIENEKVSPRWTTWDRFCELKARHERAEELEERLKMPGASPFDQIAKKAT